ERKPVLEQEVGREAPAAAGDRVPEGLARLASLSQPARGDGVQVRNLGRTLPPKLGTEELEEKGVIPVQGRAARELRDERVLADELVQHSLAVRAACERVGELARDRVDDGRLQEEGLKVGAERAEHLVRQVVGDRTLVAREVVDEAVRRPAGADRDTDEGE